jgi:hypothetical protein
MAEILLPDRRIIAISSLSCCYWSSPLDESGSKAKRSGEAPANFFGMFVINGKTDSDHLPSCVLHFFMY